MTFRVGDKVVIERRGFRGDPTVTSDTVTRDTVTKVGRKYGYTGDGSRRLKFDLATGREATSSHYGRTVCLADGYEERKAAEKARADRIARIVKATRPYHWMHKLSDEQLDLLADWLDRPEDAR